LNSPHISSRSPLSLCPIIPSRSPFLREKMFKPTKRIEGAHKDGIWSVKWAENLICSGSLDGTAKLWNSDLTPIATSKQQKLGITSVTLAPENRLVLSCSQESHISLMDQNMNEVSQIDPGFLEAWSLSISPHQDVICSGTHRGSVALWSVRDTTSLGSLETGNKFVLSTDFQPTGTKLAASGIDGMLNIFDLSTLQIVAHIEAHAMASRCVRFSHDGNLIFTVSDDRHAIVFDSRTHLPINSFSHSGMALCLDTSADNRHFIVGCANHNLSYWDLGMQRCVQSFDSQHSEQIWGVSFNEHGDQFVSVGDDGLIQLFESSAAK
jgi:WD40 repeat protein